MDTLPEGLREALVAQRTDEILILGNDQGEIAIKCQRDPHYYIVKQTAHESNNILNANWVRVNLLQNKGTWNGAVTLEAYDHWDKAAQQPSFLIFRHDQWFEQRETFAGYHLATRYPYSYVVHRDPTAKEAVYLGFHLPGLADDVAAWRRDHTMPLSIPTA